ncbi:hypothetical protein SAMN06265360_113133 [Haloechinothrix alba]|uniref:Uncharacterized protein n=1 Tax=Haloechinothrix alba TaxID=664784 RepID=A0A238Y6K5_9PSEU|nr:hypothetical protein [Haloechinothrix alba]SNR66204.1 hypothetical protein SAMN06265360_113133 [Haloechinothrix alba]
MLVDVRPTKRLHGSSPLDVRPVLGPLVQALGQDSVDLSRLRVVCDWIQYKHNFRDTVDVRSITTTDGMESAVEVAVDLRRAGSVDISDEVVEALREHRHPDTRGRTYLEPWTPGKNSCIWDFNALYWQALSSWEQATGAAYEQALPGGSSDARSVGAAREMIHKLFSIWDELAVHNALPDELYVIELGVGNGGPARIWLDEFRVMAQEHGGDYYRRLHYIMGDYSPYVLKQAQHAVAEHATKVSSIVLDATDPASALGFLRHKAFLAYVSNVYDNLPTDEVASLSGRMYRVEVRAYVANRAAERLAEHASLLSSDIVAVAAKLLRLGPELLAEAMPAHFPDVGAAVRFWQELWAEVRLEERYVPLEGLDLYEIAPSVTGEALRPVLEGCGDIRMQVSNGAVASFVGTLPLLHPYGYLHCHDLFVTDPARYDTNFCGPGKYDGSVVNWVNGPLLRYIGNRRGFDVDFVPFTHRASTNIMTLTAQARD